MSARRPLLQRTWAVGRYQVTLTVPALEGGVVHAAIEWAPHMPTDLTVAELEAYRRGRNAALKELGLSALVID